MPSSAACHPSSETKTTTMKRRAFIRRRLIVVAVKAMAFTQTSHRQLQMR